MRSPGVRGVASLIVAGAIAGTLGCESGRLTCSEASGCYDPDEETKAPSWQPPDSSGPTRSERDPRKRN